MKSFLTGVPGFDEVLGGGLWEGSLYLLEGLPGTGKTILANQIAFGRAAAGDRVLYVSLISESHGKLIHHLRSMAFFDESQVGERITYVSGYRSLADEGLSGLLDFLTAGMKNHRPAFLVIEGFSSAEYLTHKALELAQFLHQLNAMAATMRCTTLLVTHDQGDRDHPDHTL
ncbi:MAG TPA: ATPase domain-containing protein, partial [Burkholderiales bacterium]|nr:ATPase domain-containing protein [Burkholderiales bacterium]